MQSQGCAIDLFPRPHFKYLTPLYLSLLKVCSLKLTKSDQFRPRCKVLKTLVVSINLNQQWEHPFIYLLPSLFIVWKLHSQVGFTTVPYLALCILNAEQACLVLLLSGKCEEFCINWAVVHFAFFSNQIFSCVISKRPGNPKILCIFEIYLQFELTPSTLWQMKYLESTTAHSERCTIEYTCYNRALHWFSGHSFGKILFGMESSLVKHQTVVWHWSVRCGIFGKCAHFSAVMSQHDSINHFHTCSISSIFKPYWSSFWNNDTNMDSDFVIIALLWFSSSNVCESLVEYSALSDLMTMNKYIHRWLPRLRPRTILYL